MRFAQFRSKLTGITAAVVLFMLLGRRAEAQSDVSKSLTDSQLRSIGLERAWHTQLQFDSARGRLSGIYLQISRSSKQLVYEVTYPGGRQVFSERGVDTLGKPLRRKGAKEAVDKWIAQWQAEHPDAKEAPVVKESEVEDSSLVTASESGMVQLLNAETGKSEWVVKVGSNLLPTLPPAANEKYVTVVNGSRLYLLSRENGSIAWERKTVYPPGGAPAISNQFVFVPMINGIMESFDLDFPRRPSETVSSHGRIFVQPVVFKDAVAWTTDRGFVYVANSEANGLRFRVSSSEEANAKSLQASSSNFLPGTPTFLATGDNKPHRMYFGTAEGYVYCCDSDRGNVLNRFSAGESFSQSPVVVRDRVYAITDSGSLYCMSSDTMLEQWWSPGITQFVAASEDRVYVVDRTHRLVALDALTGSRMGSVALNNIDFVFTNIKSDRIYLGTSTGVLQCLHEAKRHYPWVHSGMKAKKVYADVLNANNASEPEAEPEMEAEKKPATKEADDPFGGPAAKEEKKPAAMEDDPFK